MIKDNPLLKISLCGITVIVFIYFAIIVDAFVYNGVNRYDATIWWRYASNNELTSNIYFERCIETESFLNSLSCDDKIGHIFNDGIIYSQEYDELRNNIDRIVEYAENDDLYLEYLYDNGYNLDKLQSFVYRMGDLERAVTRLSLFIIYFLCCFLIVNVFKYRKFFYILAGIICFIAVASDFSLGLSDYLITPAINFIGKLSRKKFEYSDTLLTAEIFTSVVKESMLTFIVFDTLIQEICNNKKTKLKEDIRKLQFSLILQKDYISSDKYADTSYTAILKIPNFSKSDVMKAYRKKVRKYKRMSSRKNAARSNAIYENCKTIHEDLYKIFYNKDEMQNSDYIELMKELSDLLATTGVE